MYNDHIILAKSQLSIRIPSSILSNTELSFNQKLILALDFTLSTKRGYNAMTNKTISQLFGLHPNIVSYCRRQLLDNGYLTKGKGKHYLTDKYKQFKTQDGRTILLPHQVYSHQKLCAGAKLLWGEYNSLSKGNNEYFASRDYTAKRLNCSLESVTYWTKILFEYNLLDSCKYNSGYGKSQKVVITSKFRDSDYELVY